MTPAHGVPVQVRTADGVELAAMLYEPPSGTGPVTVIASAAAVPQGYYQPFARALAARGRPTLTFDYRGIGGSLHGPLAKVDARMRDWGQRDVPAVLEHVAQAFPGRPIHWVGHSYGGGFAVGLTPNSHRIARHLGIAVPHGWWREMAGLERYRVAVAMGVITPLTTALLGYLPSKQLGIGENLPAGVAREWASWILARNSMWDTIPADELRGYAAVRAPMAFIRLTDDAWASAASVARMMAQFPNAAERREIVLTPGDAGGQPIGHIGFFRARFAETLWPHAFRWLETV
jgi:predicted alpha/beta hydrolase